MKTLELNKIYKGNCLDVLKTFPDESIDMCITSPPYWGLRDYGTATWEGGDTDCSHKIPSSESDPKQVFDGNMGSHVIRYNRTHCKNCGAKRIDDQLGLEKTPEEYVENLANVFDEVKRVLRSHGSCWVNLGDTYGGSGNASGHTGETKNLGKKTSIYGATKGITQNLMPKCLIQIPSRFAIEMVNRGWTLRNELIWHKPSCMPSSATDRFTVDFEKMFFFTKNKKYYFKQQFEELSYSYMKDKRPAVLRNKLYEDSKYVKAGMMEKVPYAVQPRTKEFINYRDLPKHDDIREYLTEWKDKMGITIKEIEEHFGTQAGHHWFEKDSSYPSVEDWKGLKELLEFDDKYDEVMTTEHVKSSEKTHDPRGRNKRTVWSINPASFKEAHFAVYPPELIETPIDAGCPLYVCSKCGKAREKIMKAVNIGIEKSNTNYPENFNANNLAQKRQAYRKLGLEGPPPKELLGYTDCGCNEDFVPGVVLDPFIGSGTTAEVAMKQDKNWVGIDLNPEYIELADKRLKPAIIEKKTRDKAKDFWE